MEFKQEEMLNSQVIQRAWDDAAFKKELIADPVAAMEKLTGEKLNLPEGKKLTVIDESDDSTIYFHIPQKVELDSLQLTEEQLEQVAGGITPTFVAFGYGFVVGVSIWAATSD